MFRDWRSGWSTTQANSSRRAIPSHWISEKIEKNLCLMRSLEKSPFSEVREEIGREREWRKNSLRRKYLSLSRACYRIAKWYRTVSCSGRKGKYHFGKPPVCVALLQKWHHVFPESRAKDILSELHCTWRKLLHREIEILCGKQPGQQCWRLQELDVPDVDRIFWFKNIRVELDRTEVNQSEFSTLRVWWKVVFVNFSTRNRTRTVCKS